MKERGITLIALVVTIIVLLILAGVTISLLIGQNGLITRTREAKLSQEIATEKEQLEMAKAAVKTSKLSKGDRTEMTAAELNVELTAEGIKATASGSNPIIVTFTESQREYEVRDDGEINESINWDEILDNATTPHPDQTESDDIGIGTDGELVNLDLWRYTLIENSTAYGLYKDDGCSYSNGYIGEIIDGKIIGKVPQYIKEGNGEFLPVTSMNYTFYEHRNLATAPVIPDTVIDMQSTFLGCSGLTTAPAIADGVIKMESTFNGCSSLTTAPMIPNTVTNMRGIFQGCSSLTTVSVISSSAEDIAFAFSECRNLITVPVIPNGVIDMGYTFYNCSNLTTAPEIPSSVVGIISIFHGCSSLTGELVINANPTNYAYCLTNASTSPNANLKLTGSSTKLNEILATKSANSNISIK